MQSGVALSNTVHRIESLRNMYQHVCACPSRYLGAYILPRSLSVISGKVKILDRLAVVAQNKANHLLNGMPAESLFASIHHSDWYPSYKTLKDSIIDALTERQKININEARLIFEREFWNHLNFRLVDQFQKSYGHQPRSESENVLRSLLDPKSRHYIDFRRVYLSLVTPPITPAPRNLAKLQRKVVEIKAQDAKPGEQATEEATGGRPPVGEDEISILIPTLNRSDYLLRALTYYRHMGFKGHICIGDSSNEQHVRTVKQAINELENQLHIIYRYYPNPPYFHDGMVMKALIELAPSNYLVYSGDDDILIPAALARCADFLKHNPEYSAAHGLRVSFKLNSKGPYGQIDETRYSKQHILESATAAQRWRSYMRYAASTQYYVHRKQTWRRMYRDVPCAPSRYLGPELLPCSLTTILGKVKQLDCLSTVFQDHQNLNNRIFSFESHPIYTLIQQPQWSPSVQGVRKRIVDALARQDNCSLEAAQDIFDQEFWHQLIKFFYTQFRQRYSVSEIEAQSRSSLTESGKNMYAMITHPQWSHRFSRWREKGIKRLLSRNGSEAKDVVESFDRDLWGYILSLLLQQYQKTFDTDTSVEKAIAVTGDDETYTYMFSTKALLDPSSTFYDDFYPIYLSLTRNRP
jgi:glycosyltransferase domain-containing protein